MNTVGSISAVEPRIIHMPSADVTARLHEPTSPWFMHHMSSLASSHILSTSNHTIGYIISMDRSNTISVVIGQ